ncbi:transposase [Pararhizobium sp. LjRoot238]|uniref:transposase n=1 Tax=Pararhizobium sp. LjRoot238 TaxID=3342293 RepID=UPI003ECC5586
MTNKDDDELSFIAARAAEIRAGLDAAYSKEELQRPLSRRMVHMLVAATTAVTAAKLGALAARVAELEAGGIRYVGSFQRALGYRKGSVTTFAGSMWTALDDVPAGVQPGSNPAFWQLSEKGSSWVRKQKEGQ